MSCILSTWGGSCDVLEGSGVSQDFHISAQTKMERVVGNRSPSTPYMASSNSAGSCVVRCTKVRIVHVLFGVDVLLVFICSFEVRPSVE